MPNSKLVAKEKPAGFAGLGLSKEIVASITALGYEEPTPVQRETIPLLLAGKDLLGQAETGTGKTAAFALPMLQRIEEAGDAGRRQPSGLILVPTRELAMQVAEAVHKYARGSKLTVLPLYGGAPMHQQIRTLDRGIKLFQDEERAGLVLVSNNDNTQASVSRADRSKSPNLKGLESQRQPVSSRKRSASVPATSPVTKITRRASAGVAAAIAR